MKEMLNVAILTFLVGLVLLNLGCGNQAYVDNEFSEDLLSTYTKDQVVFSLSLISNINEGRFGPVDSLQVQATQGVNNVLTNDTIQHLIGNWTPVWGPVTYTKDAKTNPDTCVSDNTMMLLKGKDPEDSSKTMYVLAIAGTIGVSVYDWLDEDFTVDTMALWPTFNGTSNVGSFGSPNISDDSNITDTSSYISLGVTRGLNVLFNIMEDSTEGSLMDYLKKNVGNSSLPFEIAVAGHSLGGALSPCVALSLIDNKPYWNPSDNSIISCYPTAGFSPGNENFYTYFTSQIDTNFLGAYNSNDVVPHTFDPTMMAEIATLYDNLYTSPNPYLNNQCVIDSIFNCLNSALSPFKYKALYGSGQSFNGVIDLDSSDIATLYFTDTTLYDSLSFIEKVVFDNLVSDACTNSTNGTDAENFGRMLCFGDVVLQEHFNAYINYFNISTIDSIYSQQLSTQTLPSFLLSGIISKIISFPLIENCL